MSLELGISVSLIFIVFTLAYIAMKLEKPFLKLTMICFTFLFMTLSFDVLRRLSAAQGMTNIATMMEGVVLAMAAVSTFLIFLLFIYGIKYALELYLPKRKGFKDDE